VVGSVERSDLDVPTGSCRAWGARRRTTPGDLLVVQRRARQIELERWAAAAGVSVGQMLGQWAENLTLLGRLPTLAQVRPGVTRCVRFASNGTLVLW
jgi:hypothetical protein